MLTAFFLQTIKDMLNTRPTGLILFLLGGQTHGKNRSPLWTPQVSEVAAVFEEPLDSFLWPQRWRRDGAMFGGHPLRHWWAMDLGERYLWGATAAILHSFAETLSVALDRPFSDHKVGSARGSAP